MKKWEQFSEEELKQFFYSSKTATEFAEKIGYKSRGITKDIKKRYPWCDFKERDCNLTGRKYGKLTVLEFESVINQKKCWKCRCDCGNIVHNVFSGNLKSGNTKSCGCLQKEKINDLTGQKFGKLTALEPTDERKDRRVVWKCQCDCGNITYVPSNKLKSGYTKSCGCLQKEKMQEKVIDLTGQKFGKLTVLELTDERRYRHAVWKCLCECGNIVYVTGNNLRNGTTQSCGCARGFLTAQKIGNLLDEMNIEYEKEYSFDDLKGDAYVLRFDFGIFRDKKLLCLIEYQGKQHYELIDYFGGEEGLKKRQEYDIKKQEYCKKKNIPLIIIPYWDNKNISKEYLQDKLGGILIE